MFDLDAYKGEYLFYKSIIENLSKKMKAYLRNYN